jgi:quercetin dioxygenase-like cupin family protein
MKRFNLNDAGARGWFIGNFDKAVVKTEAFEVCYQENAAGTSYAKHYHAVITEIQLITEGCMVLNGEEYRAGDICMIEPGDVNEAHYTEDTKTVAIKYPSVPDDKYYV